MDDIAQSDVKANDVEGNYADDAAHNVEVAYFRLCFFVDLYPKLGRPLEAILVLVLDGLAVADKLFLDHFVVFLARQ